VEALGGTIAAESRPGEGSTFRFSIRCRPGSPVAAPDAAGEAEAGTRRGRILLAEDNPVNRMLITTMLERVGHAVEAVENGRQAVEAVASRPIDLVLLDMQMPVMDGLEAAAEIRALPGAPSRVAIVGLSADAMAETIRKARETGFDDYVTKPIDWSRLYAVIGARLEARAARTAPQDAAAPAAPEAYASRAVLIEETARELETSFGRQGAAGFYGSLLDRLGESTARMLVAAAANDTAALRAEAHALRGAAGNMGADRLSAILTEMERQAREGVVDRELVAAAEAVAEATRVAVERRMGLDAAAQAT
jgi:CheY-like chemotaxis protein